MGELREWCCGEGIFDFVSEGRYVKMSLHVEVS